MFSYIVSYDSERFLALIFLLIRVGASWGRDQNLEKLDIDWDKVNNASTYYTVNTTVRCETSFRLHSKRHPCEAKICSTTGTSTKLRISQRNRIVKELYLLGRV
jgi:hypothetical protein